MQGWRASNGGVAVGMLAVPRESAKIAGVPVGDYVSIMEKLPHQERGRSRVYRSS